MADPLCQRFFTEPTRTLHLRYEILRAYFVEQRPLAVLAEQFGLNFYTVRSLVRTFRTQVQANQVPPFFLSLGGVVRPNLLPWPARRQRNHRRWPTAGS